MMNYKIICAQPARGIERSLPYQLDEAEAAALCDSLNEVLKKRGYIHRVEPIEAQPLKYKTVTKGRKYGR